MPSLGTIVLRAAAGVWAVPVTLRPHPGQSADEAATTEIIGATHDSRQVRRGWLFCAVRGSRADGHAFCQSAVAAGAAALLVDHPLDLAVPQIVVADTRVALGPVVAAVHDDPSHDLEVVAITGTNGKTTTAHMLASVLEHSGRPTKVIGTLSGARTTPEATDIQALLSASRAEGRAAVVMEVSSHALALHRVDATAFRVGVFTNLSPDHLDFHETMERYFRSKARLFQPEFCALAVVNADDPHGRLLADAATIPTVTFSMADAADLEMAPTSSRFRWQGVGLRLPVGSAVNVANALAAATTARQLGIESAVVAAGLEALGPIPGRFEPVHAGQPFSVVVDYAHTPDGLERVLSSARATLEVGRKLIVVFGCGGDRDRHKRPAMAEAASRHGDLVVLTSDNPRSEDPLAIIAEARAGVVRHDVLIVEPDRATAIALAIGRARPGDLVVLAGKGHETEQEIGGVMYPFDDRLVARNALREHGWLEG